MTAYCHSVLKVNELAPRLKERLFTQHKPIINYSAIFNVLPDAL